MSDGFVEAYDNDKNNPNSKRGSIHWMGMYQRSFEVRTDPPIILEATLSSEQENEMK